MCECGGGVAGARGGDGGAPNWLRALAKRAAARTLGQCPPLKPPPTPAAAAPRRLPRSVYPFQLMPCRSSPVPPPSPSQAAHLSQSDSSAVRPSSAGARHVAPSGPMSLPLEHEGRGMRRGKAYPTSFQKLSRLR